MIFFTYTLTCHSKHTKLTDVTFHISSNILPLSLPTRPPRPRRRPLPRTDRVRGAALPALASPPPHCRAAPRAASPGLLRALVRARAARALPARSAHVSPIVPTRPRARAAPATRGASHQRQVHGIARPARSGQKSAEGKRGCGGGADAHLNDLLDAARRRKGLVSRAVQLELALYGTWLGSGLGLK